MSHITATRFFQEPPHIGNQFLEDTILVESLQRLFPKDVFQSIQPDLENLGQRVVSDILEWARDSERNPPVLVQYDAWAHRIDEIRTSASWKELHKASAEEGLISIAYERKYKQWSRLYQLVKLFLFAGAGNLYGCPLAMTDGVARLLELWGTEADKKEVLPHLLSRDAKQFWTSGQWMTETTGGSDVGNTETIAEHMKHSKDGRDYTLTGMKYFTSATTSEIAVTLARIKNPDGSLVPGSKGLSTFLLHTRTPEGKLNGIQVNKLKNKLGTKQVPTAELVMDHTPAKLLGPVNRGVPVIATILNITRIHSALHCISVMRRGIAVARDYAHRRKAQNKFLTEHILHLETLAGLEAQYRGSLQLLLEVGVLMGKVECEQASKEEDILFRLLTPLLKLYTAKQAVSVLSECIEALGGTGYMEDADIPRLLRDVQVNTIWEGTTNILSLDVWRPIRSSNALHVYADAIHKKLQNANASLKESVEAVRSSLSALLKFAQQNATDNEQIEINARYFGMSLARIYIGALLIEHATWSNNPLDAEAAFRHCVANSTPLFYSVNASEKYRTATRNLALDVDPKNGKPRGCGDRAPNGAIRARF
mmetsp:Transcript_12255/g.16947  ORF Transcript_12255/g.16947 Transcript_12255/m.16947 type:complete len:595 (+) Transcript_12255:37-1821(+)|eukprot:CAMPEP_0168554096 /NCGR_PEP_ID=MMETSP0413-20121227/7597_1 /TAXON_ID=136452 /ORGANISM="Filamoeba nolandi, Strain NC-AS-23-1" /LENGTH=594 /DNA_ID=CAMNT_0008584813 /DNA_START=20 /DNA_END=1804 /DNA_ORIENTATION=-